MASLQRFFPRLHQAAIAGELTRQEVVVDGGGRCHGRDIEPMQPLGLSRIDHIGKAGSGYRVSGRPMLARGPAPAIHM